MSKKHILWLSDWNLTNNGEPQTGYTNISGVFCKQLQKDYSIIALGPSYRRTPHNYLFSLSHIPFQHFPTALYSIHQHYRIDHLVVCLDIPMQRQLLKLKRYGMKYTGIFAVEADPIYTPWAMDLSLMDNAFSISQFGKEECDKVGIPAQHLIVPVDRNIWKPRTLEEKDAIKEILGVKDKILLFMNADGNERKNTSMVIEALKILKERGRNDFYLIILTNKRSQVNWDLDELLSRWDLTKNATIIDKGISQKEVRKLYAGADFFLNVTKAEGMSYPILEAMSVGTPVVCTNATAMKDHLGENQKNGFGINANFVHIDVFGNTNRYYVFPDALADNLSEMSLILKNNPHAFDDKIENAWKYIEERNNSNSVELLRKVFDG